MGFSNVFLADLNFLIARKTRVIIINLRHGKNLTQRSTLSTDIKTEKSELVCSQGWAEVK